MAKFFASLCLVAFAATAINAQPAVNSASSNTGMNVMSTNSLVSQNDVQNAQGVGGGLAGYAAPLYAPGVAGPALGYAAPGYGFGYGLPYDYVPHGYGFGLAGYGGQVNSQSTNMGANIASADSLVSQNHVQNAASI